MTTKPARMTDDLFNVIDRTFRHEEDKDEVVAALAAARLWESEDVLSLGAEKLETRGLVIGLGSKLIRALTPSGPDAAAAKEEPRTEKASPESAALLALVGTLNKSMATKVEDLSPSELLKKVIAEGAGNADLLTFAEGTTKFRTFGVVLTLGANKKVDEAETARYWAQQVSYLGKTWKTQPVRSIREAMGVKQKHSPLTGASLQDGVDPETGLDLNDLSDDMLAFLAFVTRTPRFTKLVADDGFGLVEAIKATWPPSSARYRAAHTAFEEAKLETEGLVRDLLKKVYRSVDDGAEEPARRPFAEPAAFALDGPSGAFPQDHADGKLSGPAFGALAGALMSAFPSYGDLSQLTRFELNLDLNTISSQKPLGQVAHDIIGWAESSGQTKALIEAASRRNPGNPKLRAFVAQYASPQAPAGPNFSDRQVWIAMRSRYAELFTNPGDISMVLRDIGVDTTRVSLSGPAYLMWEAAMNEARNQLKLPALHARVKESYPRSGLP